MPRTAVSAVTKTNPGTTRSSTAISAGIDDEGPGCTSTSDPNLVEYGRLIYWPVLSGEAPEH
eukprot:14885995-Heterocapsa_arctica.AAC.1